MSQVDGKPFQHFITINQPHFFMPSHGWVEVRGIESNALIQCERHSFGGDECGVFVAAIEHLSVGPGRVAVVHAKGFQASVGDGPTLWVQREDRAFQPDCLAERQVERRVLRIAEKEGAGLNLVCPRVGVVCTGAASGDSDALDDAGDSPLTGALVGDETVAPGLKNEL